MGWFDAFYIGLLASACITDLRTRRIPNRLVASGGLLAAIGLASSGGLGEVGVGLFWGVVAAAPLIAGFLADHDAIGMGDIKATVVIGSILGARGVFVVPLACLSVMACIWAEKLVLGDAQQKRQTVPFMPFIAAGTITANFC